MSKSRTVVVVDASAYRAAHGSSPRGRGRWGFVMGKVDYERVDERDRLGRPVVYFPTAPSGMYSGDMPFALAKRLAVKEAQRRGLSLVGVAS